MKTGNAKKTLVAILASLVLASIVLTPGVKALTFNYADNFLGSFTVNSTPDVTKPGNTVSANVTGVLKVSAQTVVLHIIFYVDTASQTARILNSQDLVLSGTAQNSATAQIVVPLDALNNTYVYAVISNGTIVFSRILIALVQNPTYSELQTQIIQLRDNVTSLGAQVNSLQAQLNTAKANSTSLQNQLTDLTATYNELLDNYNSLASSSSSDKSTLLNQISTLQGQLSSLNSSNSALQSQLDSLQSDNSLLQSQLNEAQTDNASLTSQVNSLQADKDSLLNQTTVLQNQISNLQFNNTNLQTMVNILDNQTSTLRLQLSDLQSKSNTTSILLYLATFVAVAFIAATAYIIFIVVKRKGKKTQEAPLY